MATQTKIMKCFFYISRYLRCVLVAVIACTSTVAIDEIMMALCALSFRVALVFKVHPEQGLVNCTVTS